MKSFSINGALYLYIAKIGYETIFKRKFKNEAHE